MSKTLTPHIDKTIFLTLLLTPYLYTFSLYENASFISNPEKLAILHTQDTRRRQAKRKYTTQYVLDTTMRKQTQIT